MPLRNGISELAGSWQRMTRPVLSLVIFAAQGAYLAVTS
jgi:hypothetical protein